MELFGAQVIDDPDDETKLRIQIDFAPEDGMLARVLRGGERSEQVQILAQIANEAAILRAAKVPDVDSSEYGSKMWFPIKKEREYFEEHQDRIRRMQQSGGLQALWSR